MSIAAYIKKPVKVLFTHFPLLDVISRRFVWKHVYPRLFFHEPEMRFFYGLPRQSIDVAIDVGAAMGSYCWILNRSSNKIFAFEPGRIHNRCLTQAAFGTNIEVIRAAVGSAPGKVRLYTPGAESTDRYCASISLDNPVTKSDAATIDEVDQITLDAFLAERLAPDRSVDVLKVDVEGYELEVFRGAVNTISKHKPLIICEIEARHNRHYRKVFDTLKGLGYQVFVFTNGAFRPFLEERIEHLQLAVDLEKRLHEGPSESSKYVNNFVFQHADSRLRVSELGRSGRP